MPGLEVQTNHLQIEEIFNWSYYGRPEAGPYFTNCVG
jgi:hypothetical protein